MAQRSIPALPKTCNGKMPLKAALLKRTRAQRIPFRPGVRYSNRGRIHSRRPFLSSSFFACKTAADHTFPFLYGARPDPAYDPTTGNAPTNWDLYREMWGSDGEFIIDGNLKSVEWVDRLHTINVPTLIVVGDHDECDPSLSKEMHEKIAGSDLVILPNSGHMNFVDQPQMWQKAINGFLSQ